MARGRSPAYDDQREMILARAAELFAHRGYPATSMNEVAQACGFSKASLYHYYRDKYELLVSIAETHVSRLEELVTSVEAQGLPAEPRLRELIRRIVEEYAGAQYAHRVLTASAYSTSSASWSMDSRASSRPCAPISRGLHWRSR